ncbi:MAG TPA: HNH endonuclease, partial [Mycobacterium sp.]|nr:HNH endonuclease [Mycobacterium sp.]
TGGRTDADTLTLACPLNHKLIDKGWKTRKLPNGQTEWIPPPHLDHGQPRTNNYHHPERLFDNHENDP